MSKKSKNKKPSKIRKIIINIPVCFDELSSDKSSLLAFLPIQTKYYSLLQVNRINSENYQYPKYQITFKLNKKSLKK